MGILSKLLTFAPGYLYGIYEVWFSLKENEYNNSYPPHSFMPRGPYHLLTRDQFRDGWKEGGLVLGAIWLASFLVVPPIYGLLTQHTLRKTGLYLMKKL